VAIIAIVVSLTSPLAAASDIAIDASICVEADEYSVAPSCSTTVAMALGDALAFTVMRFRRLTAAELARNHPGGSIGRLFQVEVGEVMARGSRVAWVQGGDLLSHVLQDVTRSGLGCACVVTLDGVLEGLITDGDIRRALQRGLDVASPAAQLMTRNPVTIGARATLYEALQAMEGRASQISVLPVVEDMRCVGVIRCTISTRPESYSGAAAMACSRRASAGIRDGVRFRASTPFASTNCRSRSKDSQ
jgi:arabinose-5-phosphate isomerase